MKDNILVPTIYTRNNKEQEKKKRTCFFFLKAKKESCFVLPSTVIWFVYLCGDGFMGEKGEEIFNFME